MGALFGTYDGWAATEELRLRSLLQLLASAGADRVQLQDFIADQAAISWQESALIRCVGWLAACTCLLHCRALIAAMTIADSVAWPMLTSALTSVRVQSPRCDCTTPLSASAGVLLY